ncbi:glycosyltransferase [Vibrio cyclitrophicus]
MLNILRSICSFLVSKILNSISVGRVYNIDFLDSEKCNKRAAVCYITKPFLTKFDSPPHTSYNEVFNYVKVLNELGYIVDVFNYDDRLINIKVKGEYSYIFGFGKSFDKLVSENPTARNTMLLTESSPDFSIQEEKRRWESFESRKPNLSVPRLYRSGKFYSRSMIEQAESCLLIGNHTTVSSYRGYINENEIYTIDATALPTMNLPQKKDFSKAKKNFLWLGSGGAIHKGLDLLVDAFSSPLLKDCNLIICGAKDSEIKVFGRLPSNVKNFGFVNVNSEVFYSILEDTAFIILPSCSEGMSTSVLTGIKHGLIPIITRETGVSCDDAVIIDDLSISAIEDKILEQSRRDDSILSSLSNKLLVENEYKYTKKNHYNSVRDKLRILLEN